MSDREAEKKRRLAEALRNNLRRRKAQSRETDGVDKAGAEDASQD